MSKSEHVKQWRERTKKRMIEALGGKCCVCGYDRCQRALDFHHRDPTEKEMALGSIRASPRAWSYIVSELRKCILVCNRCHQEIHDGITLVPENAPLFDENFATYSLKKVAKTEPCPVCGKDKPLHNKTCSLRCAAKTSGKVDWDNIDLVKLKEKLSFVQIAEILGVSDMAVRKRWKRLEIALS